MRAMVRSLFRTFRGPSRDPRMAFISRPMPRDLRDEDVVAALERAFAANPDPTYLVETLPGALREVTGRDDLQVLDRSAGDVTGRFVKRQVMIRQGDVGRWRGYEENAYPLIAPGKRDSRRRGDEGGDGERPARMPGWEPPPPNPRGG